MLRNSAINFLIGCLMILMGFTRIFLESFGISSNTLTLNITACMIFIGFTIICFEYFKSEKHLALVSEHFLKSIPLRQKIRIVSRALQECFEQNYHDWWKSQIKQGLISDHITFGVFISLLSGITPKSEVHKYSAHYNCCPTCQHYVNTWNAEFSSEPQKE